MAILIFQKTNHKFLPLMRYEMIKVMLSKELSQWTSPRVSKLILLLLSHQGKKKKERSHPLYLLQQNITDTLKRPINCA